MENDIYKAISSGQEVRDFNIELINSASGRPSSLKVSFKVEGNKLKYMFKQ